MIIPLVEESTKVLGFASGILTVFIYVIYKIFRSNVPITKDEVDSKRSNVDRKRYNKAVSKIETKIKEVDDLYSKDILNDEEYKNQKEDLKKESRQTLAEYQLKNSSKYKDVIQAFKKGYITEEQKDKKVDDILVTIFENIIKGEKKS